MTSNNWNAVPISKPTPFGRPKSSTISTIFQTSDRPDRDSRREIGRELRQHDVAQPLPAAHAEHCRHLIEITVERARPLAHRDGCNRQLVEDDGGDRRGFRQARPYIGKHDDDQRRQVEQHHQPGIADPVRQPDAAHREPDAVPSTMAIEKAAATRASVTPRLKASAPERASVDDSEPDRLRRRQQPRTGQMRARKPQRKQQRDRGKPQCEIHSLGPAV